MIVGIDARYLSADYSGIGTYSRELLQAMALEDGDEREYVVMVHSSFHEDLDLPDNFRMISDPANPVSLRTLTTLGDVFTREGADILHSHFPLAPRSFRGPSCLTLHDLQPLLDPDFTGLRPWPVRAGYDVFYRTVYPACLRRADAVVCVSQATRAALRGLMPEVADKALAVPSGVPDSAWDEPDAECLAAVRERFDLPKRFILYLGSTRPNKNLPRMLDAFEVFCREHPEHDDVKWVMVLKSDRFFDPLLAGIRDRGLLKRVQIHEQVSESEKRAFYKSASLLYFVTKHEGFGLPVLEAQAQDLPVLASTHASLPEVAGRGALLADPDDTAAIAAALGRFFGEAGLAERLAELGRANVKRFSWRRAAREIIDMYDHLLS